MTDPCQYSVNEGQKSGVLPSMPFRNQLIYDGTQEPHRCSQFSVSVGSFSSSIEHFDQGNIAYGTNPVSSPMAVQFNPIALGQGLTPSEISPLLAGTNVMSLPKRPFVGQKNPFSMFGVPSPVTSKKQKLSESFPELSIEQINDVAATSGANLKEEGEQLVSMPMNENDTWEVIGRRLVREEEEKLFLQTLPLQRKLAMIVLKCGGLTIIAKGVERCLSLCVKERMRLLIGNLIRLSKQRVDVERFRHSVLFTSDVQHQIQLLNQKAKEDLEKKREEVVKPPKMENINSYKYNRMLANNAARVAFGGDDMQLRWQKMAEQARQKLGGGRDILPDIEGSGSSVAFSNSAPPLSGSLAKISRTISIKDMIAALESEPQMSNSSLLYSLHEQMRKNTSAEWLHLNCA